MAGPCMYLRMHVGVGRYCVDGGTEDHLQPPGAHHLLTSCQAHGVNPYSIASRMGEGVSKRDLVDVIDREGSVGVVAQVEGDHFEVRCSKVKPQE